MRKNRLEAIDDDIFLYSICPYLKLEDLARIKRINKTFNSLLNSPKSHSLFKGIFKRHWPTINILHSYQRNGGIGFVPKAKTRSIDFTQLDQQELKQLQSTVVRFETNVATFNEAMQTSDKVRFCHPFREDGLLTKYCGCFTAVGRNRINLIIPIVLVGNMTFLISMGIKGYIPYPVIIPSIVFDVLIATPLLYFYFRNRNLLTRMIESSEMEQTLLESAPSFAFDIESKNPTSCEEKDQKDVLPEQLQGGV